MLFCTRSYGCCHSGCYYSSRRYAFAWGANFPNSCLFQCLDKYSPKGTGLGLLPAILRNLRSLTDNPGCACTDWVGFLVNMAVISDYEDEEPAQTPKTDATTKVQEINLKPGMVTPTELPSASDLSNSMHDHTLTTLLKEHSQQPLDLLTTVIDFLFRESNLSQQEGWESKVSEILSTLKRRRTEPDSVDVVPEKVAKVQEKEVEEETVTNTSEPQKSPNAPMNVAAVDLNEDPLVEEVEELNGESSPAKEEDDAVSDVKENITPGVDDYDENIDGKGLSKYSFLSLIFSYLCLAFRWLKSFWANSADK